MKCKLHWAMLAAAFVTTAAGADTVYLTNGVEFDGVVTPVPEDPELFRVTAGERSLVYRASEIDRIEKNEKTGKQTNEEIMARWQEQDKLLTEQTGLTADQRRLVQELMFELISDNASKRLAVREKLVALQKEFDAYKYLASEWVGVSILIAPNLLEVLTFMDSSRAIELLEEAAVNNYYGTRSMALDLLGRLGETNSKDLVARGMVDHKQEVQISAVYALAAMKVREATPALIGLLPNQDKRVSNASKEALQALWADVLPDPKPSTVDDWTALWNGQEKSSTPIELAGLEPLSNPVDEIETSIDSNHGAPPVAETTTAEESAPTQEG